MDGSSNINFFQSVRVGREGSTFARSIRALGFLFDCWAKYDGNRDSSYEEIESGALRVIAFTKFSRHFSNVWNNLFKEDIENFRRVIENGTAEDLKNIITFPSPWTEVSGPHGRQPGIYESGQGPPIYQIEILFKLQQLGQMQFFQIEPPKDSPSNPAHYKTIIKRGMEQPDEELFLVIFTEKEKKKFKRLGAYYQTP